jgi:hypothetical protein
MYVSGMTKEELLQLIFEDVVFHYKTYGEPLPLKVIAQRHGRRARPAGLLNFGIALHGDDRFLVKMKKDHSRHVVPRELFFSMMAEADVDTAEYWRGFGAKLEM